MIWGSHTNQWKSIDLSIYQLSNSNPFLKFWMNSSLFWTYISSNFQLILFISNSVVGVKRFMTCSTARGGGTPLYQVYRYVLPQRVWFLSRFGLKSGIDFEHLGLKLGMIIGRTFRKAYKFKFIFLPSNRGE